MQFTKARALFAGLVVLPGFVADGPVVVVPRLATA
jgi:hypothetical protein